MDTNDFNAQVIREFRENSGTVGGPFQGATMLILHTTGAKSGQERITPLVYFPYKCRRYIVASVGGAPHNPAWYHNLVAHPDVTIEISSASSSAPGSDITVEEVIANEIHGAEHADVWKALVAAMPGFGDYQRKTTRQIPLIALD
ncbi:MAG: nitroreductase family deazaflavin-dependent oxidoreductase [Chloroflexota bacterium]|nr:nitroreductase family deazaflavin-dependent oxidoreductase [Chloroflexota bacterium]